MAIHYQKTMTFHLEGLKYLKVLSLSKTWNYTGGTSPFRVPVFSSTGFNNWALELHCGRHLLQNIHEDSFYPSGQAGDTSHIQTILWFMQFNIIRKQQSPVVHLPFPIFSVIFIFEPHLKVLQSKSVSSRMHLVLHWQLEMLQYYLKAGEIKERLFL